MTENNLRNYYTVFIDCWNLFKKYSEPVTGDEYWKAFLDEANELYKKHGKVPFSEKLLNSVIEEIESFLDEAKWRTK